MHKVRTIDDKFKRDNNKIKPLNRKKTYDPKNIINLFFFNIYYLYLGKV